MVNFCDTLAFSLFILLLSYTKEGKGGTFVWFESHPKSYYAQRLLKVKERWQKCADMQGDYVEM